MQVRQGDEVGRIEVNVPALTVLGHRAHGFSAKAKTAEDKIDGSGAGLPHTLSCATRLTKVESVWIGHLDDLKTDLRVVGENLVTTVQTCRGHDDASTDLFKAISWADQHHFGVRP